MSRTPGQNNNQNTSTPNLNNIIMSGHPNHSHSHSHSGATGGGGSPQQMIPNGNGQTHKNQVIHIRGDSDSELQALFDSVLKPQANPGGKMRTTVPFRLRKLPDSFFNPPSVGSKSPCHSRENSLDNVLNSVRRSPLSTAGVANAIAAAAAAAAAAANNNGNGNNGGSTPSAHSRAHSSPATLEQTYSVAASQPGLSLSGSNSANNLSDDPLPPGWEQAFTPEGQVYFINHITRSTTWEDPRKAQNQQILAAVNNNNGILPQLPPVTASSSSSSSSTSSSSSSGNPNVPSLSSSGPIPEGWEQAITPEGEVYFIDHRNRTTSWFDPRIPVHLQRPQVLQHQINAAALAQASAAAALAAAAANANANSNNANHNASGPEHNFALAGASAAGLLSNTSVQLARQHEAKLQQLQLERERLKIRQQEIMQQMEKEHARIKQQNRPQSQVQAMDESPSVDIDPFLGGVVNPSTPSSDFHSRQESADSGLGMGNPYTLPNTPEDYLSNMDDNMDTISESIDGPDIGNLGHDVVVDPTDDLVPSLHISEELSSELLDEMLPIINSKADNTMTWL